MAAGAGEGIGTLRGVREGSRGAGASRPQAPQWAAGSPPAWQQGSPSLLPTLNPTLKNLPSRAAGLLLHRPPWLEAWTAAQGPWHERGRGLCRAAEAVRRRWAGVGPRRLPAAGAGAGSCAAGALPLSLPPSPPPGSPPPRRGFAPFSRPLRFLSSSGSYSFPARKQPCLLKKPPWPQRGPGLGTRALSRLKS